MATEPNRSGLGMIVANSSFNVALNKPEKWRQNHHSPFAIVEHKVLSSSSVTNKVFCFALNRCNCALSEQIMVNESVICIDF